MTIDQPGFWKEFKNHAETRRLLDKHGIVNAPADFDLCVQGVAKSWMKLAVAHLKEAEGSYSLGFRRSFYSRGYYAVYNASKSVRYFVDGFVSDKGEDHRKVSELPRDFPDLEKWGKFLRDMYEYRLVADYEGWPHSMRGLNIDMKTKLNDCKGFIKTSKKYIRDKFGVRL